MKYKKTHGLRKVGFGSRGIRLVLAANNSLLEEMAWTCRPEQINGVSLNALNFLDGQALQLASSSVVTRGGAGFSAVSKAPASGALGCKIESPRWTELFQIYVLRLV